MDADPGPVGELDRGVNLDGSTKEVVRRCVRTELLGGMARGEVDSAAEELREARETGTLGDVEGEVVRERGERGERGETEREEGGESGGNSVLRSGMRIGLEEVVEYMASKGREGLGVEASAG